MCVAINSQMQLSLDTTALFAVFFDFPFTFTKNLQPGGINHQMRDFTPGGSFETDIDRFRPFADTAVIRAAQLNIHQGKNGIYKTLRGSQGEPEYPFNHQNGGDGQVRITLRSSP